jgi:hypothetical protein
MTKNGHKYYECSIRIEPSTAGARPIGQGIGKGVGMEDFVLVQNAVFIWMYSNGLRPVENSRGRFMVPSDEYGNPYTGPEPSYVEEYRKMLDAKLTAEEADSYW